MDEEKPKFAMTMAKIFIEEQSQKPIFGKPYIMAGAFWGVCGYLFQQCALLGKLYSTRDIVPFMRVFVAQEGKELTAFEFLSSMVSNEIIPLWDDLSTFQDIVTLRERARIQSFDNPSEFFLRYGKEKLPQPQSTMIAAEWASYGGCLGLMQPKIIAEMFETSYKPNSDWEEAYKLGIVSTPKQPDLKIEDAEKAVSEIFNQYCGKFYPELLNVLF